MLLHPRVTMVTTEDLKRLLHVRNSMVKIEFDDGVRPVKLALNVRNRTSIFISEARRNHRSNWHPSLRRVVSNILAGVGEYGETLRIRVRVAKLKVMPDTIYGRMRKIFQHGGDGVFRSCKSCITHPSGSHNQRVRTNDVSELGQCEPRKLKDRTLSCRYGDLNRFIRSGSTKTVLQHPRRCQNSGVPSARNDERCLVRFECHRHGGGYSVRGGGGVHGTHDTD